jgi:predicted metal-dependent hydrolase
MDVINMNKVLQHFLKKPIRQVYKRILVEMSQKYTLECTRKETKNFKDNIGFYCPSGCHIGDRHFTFNSKNESIKITLNRCHVGLRRADIIDKILDEHPNETNVHTLLQKVLEYHLREDVQVVFACQTCNKKLEQEVPVNIIV